MKEINPTFSYNLIYIFSINDEHHRGTLKIGQTTICTNLKEEELKPNCSELNKAAKKRIDEYTKTAAINYKLEYTQLAIKNTEYGKKVFKDIDVNNVLKRSNIDKAYKNNNKRQGQEWFKIK